MMCFLLVYSFVLIFGLNQTGFILILLVLEWLSWLLSTILEMLVMKYLLIQSYFSLAYLLALFSVPSMMIISLMLKLGLPPFHNWAISLLKLLKESALLSVMTFHKVMPIILSGKCFSMLSSMLSVLLLGVLFLRATGLFLVTVLSSFLHGWWFIIAEYCCQKLFWSYWLMYSMTLFLFMTSIHHLKSKFFTDGQNTLSSILFLILSGFPPFLLFWMKVSVFFVLTMKSITLTLVLFSLSVISLFAYFRAFSLSTKLSMTKSSKLIPALAILLMTGFFC